MCCGSRQGQKDKIKKGWGGPHTMRTNIRGGQRGTRRVAPSSSCEDSLPCSWPTAQQKL